MNRVGTNGFGYRKGAYCTSNDCLSGVEYAANDGQFKYSMLCPVCQKRVFDISELSCNNSLIRLKCPHCRKIVVIPISAP